MCSFQNYGFKTIPALKDKFVLSNFTTIILPGKLHCFSFPSILLCRNIGLNFLELSKFNETDGNMLHQKIESIYFANEIRERTTNHLRNRHNKLFGMIPGIYKVDIRYILVFQLTLQLFRMVSNNQNKLVCANMLLAKFANVNLPNQDGDTPIIAGNTLATLTLQ